VKKYRTSISFCICRYWTCITILNIRIQRIGRSMKSIGATPSTPSWALNILSAKGRVSPSGTFAFPLYWFCMLWFPFYNFS
jgi:hypothetical protein